jgi:hypothetical protein
MSLSELGCLLQLQAEFTLPVKSGVKNLQELGTSGSSELMLRGSQRQVSR